MKNLILNRVVIAAIAASLGWSSAAAAEGDEVKESVRVIGAGDSEAPVDVRHARHVVVEASSDNEAPTEPYAFLGVETARASSTVREQLGLPRGIGLVVQRVVKDTAATEVLKKHDILMKLDDQLLVNADQLGVLVRSKNPGDEVTLTLMRGGQEQVATVKLGERKGGSRAIGFGGSGFEFHDLQGKMGDLHERLQGLHGNISSEEVDRLMEVVQAERDEGDKTIAWRQRGDGPVVRMLNVASGNVVYSDEDGVVELTSNGDGRTLLIKDAKGKVIFSGPMNTAEERAELNEALRARLRKVENIEAIETVPADRIERGKLRVLGGGEESAAIPSVPPHVAFVAPDGDPRTL